MIKLARIKPDPIPAVHPLPEYAVEGERAQWYGEMKAALQVPWMGVVTMAFAHYPAFFRELWRGLKPLVASRPFVEEAKALQDLVEGRVAGLNPPPIGERLTGMGYGMREISSIRDTNDVFSHGNHAYALIATIARMLMENGSMDDKSSGTPPVFEGRHAPDLAVPFVLMEAHHADPPTQAGFEDVKAVLGLPFVNTDYRAFARWPSYWAAAWGDLREVAGTTAHEAICQEYHDRLAKAVGNSLPNPGGLGAQSLRQAAETDASIDEVLQVCRLFQWLLPGLATNVAYLKLQLTG
ncbi:MAG: hypothetical protein HQ512_01610 [Rhodospirillales bacterium]|nr:hypothetical protein [Rhodospirillales bacterium]